jgi:hypothetical protein
MEYVPTQFGNMIPRHTMREQAIEFAEAQTANGMDWQEIQTELFNGRYAGLFPSAISEGEISDEDAEYAMAIIREAEGRLTPNH